MKETRKKGVGKMIDEGNVLIRGLRETATIVLAKCWERRTESKAA